jgi:hypothetical protein
MADIGVTETSATAVDIVAGIVQDVLKQTSFLIPTVTDFSSYAVKGAKEVQIPRRTQFAAGDKAENSALTAQVLTFAVDAISLAKHKAILARMESIAAIQAMPDVEAEIIKEMAAELALQIDKDLYVQLKLASAAAPDHRVAFANASTLGKSDILNARYLLNTQVVPGMDRYLLVNPLHEKELLAIDDFVHVDKYGSANPVQLGELGMLYGSKVIMSTVCEDNNVIYYHKSAVGFAMQKAPTFESMRDLPNVATEYLLWELYGSKVMDSGKRQVLIGTAA